MFDELLKEAFEYVDMGWSVIPLEGKRALVSWKEYQKRYMTKDEVKLLFEGCKDKVTGIGIMTGFLSDLAVLDIEKEQDHTLLDIPDTATVQSGGGGRHYYFKYPKDIDEIKCMNLRQQGIIGDVKADGGYIVAPSSHHESGNKYKWLKAPSDEEELADFPQWLLETGKEKKATETDWEILFKGAEEGERHNTAVQIVGKLLRYIPETLWDDAVLPAFMGWNERNNPPLPDQEMYEIYNGIAKKEQSNRVGLSPDNKITILSLNDLLRIPTTQNTYIIEKMIPQKGISVISGHPGSGKSWIMLSMAEAVASGKRLWDKFETTQGSVLIIDEENGDTELQRRLKMLNSESKLPIYFSIQQSVRIDDEVKMSTLLNIVRDKDIKFIIIDPFAAIHSATENSADEVQKVLTQLQRFNQAGATVLAVHHHRKDNGFRKSGAGQNLRGSSALSARLDSHISVDKQKEDESGIELLINHDKSRRGPRLPSFNVLIKSDKTGESEKIDVVYVGDADAYKLKKDEVKEIIMGVLENDKMFASEIIPAVKSEMKISDSNILKAIRELEDSLTVHSEKEGKKKKYFIPLEQIEGEEL
ncbi:MAG: helicase, phage-associated [Candidatus Taylorbacteria bacterium]|nr:helicase, phage-associated [Candidatus Taylorbacteria bacterium]